MELGLTPELNHRSAKGVTASPLNPLRGEQAWLCLGGSPGSGPTAHGDRPSSHIPVPSYAPQNRTPDPGLPGTDPESWAQLAFIGTQSGLGRGGLGNDTRAQGGEIAAGEEGSWPGGSDSKTKCPAERAFLLGAQVTLL